jgi:hypothetical protein
MRLRFALPAFGIALLAGCNTATLSYPPDNVADANLDACYFHCYDGGDDGGDATAGDATGGDATDGAAPVDAAPDSVDATPASDASDAGD